MFARKLFALASVAYTGLSVRVSEMEGLTLGLDEELEDSSLDERAIVENASDICGGSAIWNAITWGETDGKGDGMNKAIALEGSWSTIEEIKTQFMDMQKSEKTRLEKDIADMKVKLKEEIAKEGKKKTEKNDHDALIKLGFGSVSYGGIDVAKRWKCGATRRDKGERLPKTLRDADELAKTKFGEIATKYLKEKDVLLNGKAFLDDCLAEMMAKDESEADNFCADVCQGMKLAGMTASNQFGVSNEGQSQEFKRKITEAETELMKVTKSMESCETDFALLSGFKDETRGLRLHYEQCGKDFRAARRLLRDLHRAAQAVDRKLAEEEEKLKEATDLLQASKGDTKDAITALEDAKTKDGKLKTEISGLVTTVDSVEKDLQAAENANGMLGDLKTKVTDTMMKMVQWGDAGIRQPLFDMGFSENPSDLNMNDPSGIGAGSVLHSSLDAMSTFCHDTALPTFRLIKDELDLTPLCGFDSTENMFSDLVQAVTQRYKSMKTDVTMVVDWLNPWKALKLGLAGGKQKELDLVNEGQLMGLEQVKAFYTAPANDFFPYLIGWRKGGPHHELVETLADHIGKLAKMRESFKQKLESSMAASTEALDAKKEAAKKLKEAQLKEADKADLKVAVEKTLTLLEEDANKLTEDISAFQEKYQKAAEAVEKAKQALAEAYKKATE